MYTIKTRKLMEKVDKQMTKVTGKAATKSSIWTLTQYLQSIVDTIDTFKPEQQITDKTLTVS